jgi:hypothetical protein
MRYWKRVDKDGKTTTVESYSHDLDIQGAVEIGIMEFDSYLASLPVQDVKPPRDIIAEFDELKGNLKVKGII